MRDLGLEVAESVTSCAATSAPPALSRSSCLATATFGDPSNSQVVAPLLPGQVQRVHQHSQVGSWSVQSWRRKVSIATIMHSTVCATSFFASFCLVGNG